MAIEIPAACISEILQLADVNNNEHNSNIATKVAKLFANKVIRNATSNMEHYRKIDMHSLYVQLALTYFAEEFSQMVDNQRTFNLIVADDDNSLSSIRSTSLDDDDDDDVSLICDYDSADESEDSADESEDFILDQDSPLWETRDTTSATAQLFYAFFAPIEEINHLSDIECINNILQPLHNKYKSRIDWVDDSVGLFKHAMYSFVVSYLVHCNGDSDADAGRYLNWMYLSNPAEEEAARLAEIERQEQLERERLAAEVEAAWLAENERQEQERLENERIERERLVAEEEETARLAEIERGRIEQERVLAEQQAAKAEAARQAEIERVERERISAVSFQEDDTTTEGEDSMTTEVNQDVTALRKIIHELEHKNKALEGDKSLLTAVLKRKNVEIVDLSADGASNEEAGDNSAKRVRLTEDETVSKMMKVKQEEEEVDKQEEEVKETSDEALVVGTRISSRVTRASVTSTIRKW